MTPIGKHPLLSSVLGATALVMAFAASSSMDNADADFAEAYKRGLDSALSSTEAESRIAATQIRDICAQTWPDTLEGARARRVACGPQKSTGSPL